MEQEVINLIRSSFVLLIMMLLVMFIIFCIGIGFLLTKLQDIETILGEINAKLQNNNL